jgi:hypothetical protein
MRTHTHPVLSRAAWWLALLLGQTSLLFGFMVALGWTLAFALIVPTKAHAWMTGQGMALPLEPPLIGLTLGGLGLLAAHWSRGHEPVAKFSVAGIVFSTLAMGLAMISIVACSAR